MLDMDGGFTYSNVIKLRCSAGQNNVFVYPNPAGDALHLAAGAAQKLTVYNIQGLPVLTRQIAAGNTTLDIQALAYGTYYLHLDGQQIRFVKSH